FWAFPVEFQAAPDADMLGRLLEFLGRLRRQPRPAGGPGDRYQLGAAVVNLTGRGSASCDMQAAGGRVRLCLQVVEKNLQAEEAAATLEAIAGGAGAANGLAGIPLMHGGGEAGSIGRGEGRAAGDAGRRRR